MHFWSRSTASSKKTIFIKLSVLAFIVLTTLPSYNSNNAVNFEEQPIAGAEIAPEVLEVLNWVRAVPQRCGRKPFKMAPDFIWDENLAKAALDHAIDYAKTQVSGHQGTDGSSVKDRIKRYSQDYFGFGENLSYRAESPYRAIYRLIGSEGHCRIIIDAGYTHVGVAKYRDPNGTMPEGGADIWVIKFGKSRNTEGGNLLEPLNIQPLQSIKITVYSRPKEGHAHNLKRDLENHRIAHRHKKIEPSDSAFFDALEMQPHELEPGLVIVDNRIYMGVFTIRQLLEKIERKDFVQKNGLKLN